MTPSYRYTRSQWDALPSEGNPETGARIWMRLQQQLEKRRRTRRLLTWSLSAVSVAALLAMGVFIGRNSVGEPAVREIRTRSLVARGAMTVLPDGSRVWLEKDGHLSYTGDLQEDRTVILEGNASFDVVHRPDASLFTVQLGNGSIQVHGTRFSVKQDVPDEVSIALYDGAVVFLSPSGRCTSLSPDERLTYRARCETVEVEPLFAGMEWQEGTYKLREMDLDQLVAFIRWQFNVEVYVSPKVSSRKMSLTGSIAPSESVESVVDKICYVMGLDYRREGNAFWLFPVSR